MENKRFKMAQMDTDDSIDLELPVDDGNIQLEADTPDVRLDVWIPQHTERLSRSYVQNLWRKDR